MKNNNNEGIVFDNTIYLSDENNKRFPIYMRLLQVLVIFLGSYCFMHIFINCFDLNIIYRYLITAIVLLVAVFYSLILYSKYDFIKNIPLLILYGGFIYYWFNSLKNGFYLLENAIIKKSSSYYGFEEFSFVAENSTANRDITLLLIVIIVPVIWITTLALLRSRLKLLCSVIMIIPAAASFAMGITPREADLLIIILVLLFISITNGYSYDKSSLLNTLGSVQNSMIYRISIRSAAILCILALILFFIIKLFVPVKEYEAYDGIQETKIKVQSFMMDFSLSDVTDKLQDISLDFRPNRAESSGGLSLGKLGRADQVAFDETEHLIITVPMQSLVEGIYLKGYIGSEYTGDSWDTHSRKVRKSYNDMIANIKKDYYNPALASSELLNLQLSKSYVNKGNIHIRYLRANKDYIYAPYFALFQEKDVTFEYDLAVVSDKDIEAVSYDYYYINKIDLSMNIDDFKYSIADILYTVDNKEMDRLIKFYENEEIYQEFVYETYTKLPKDGLERLKHDFSREEVGEASENILDAVEYVKDYLNSFTDYSLSPGRLPKNEDFVEYFLYGNQIGYCAHYASAGALMLRAMGYPARYVEGYAMSSSDLMNQKVISYISDEQSMVEAVVKDYNAHAWVEVYYDGFGWIPIEFTKSSEMEDFIDELNVFNEQSQRVIEKEPIVTPSVTAPSPTEVPNENKITPAPEPNKDEDIDGRAIIKDDDKAQSNIWYVVAPLTLISLGGLIVYLVFRTRLSKDINEDNYSKRALYIFRKIERLFVLSNALPKKTKSLEEVEEYVKVHLTPSLVESFVSCMETVRKARFGKKPISLQEYMSVDLYYNSLWDNIYGGLPFIKKAYFRLYKRLFIY